MKLSKIIERIKARYSKSFRKITFPVVKKKFSELAAKDIVSIQPMTAAVGSIFYLDYTYGNNKFDKKEEMCHIHSL